MTEENIGRIKLRRRRLLQSGAFLGSTVGVGLPALGAGPAAAAGTLFTDDFEDGDLSEWQTSTTSNAGVRLDGGRMRLRVYKCNTAIAERSLGDLSGTLTVSFDWENLSQQWYESTGWHLLDGDGNDIDYEVVEGTDVRSPGYRGNRSGSVTVEATVDGPVTLGFQVSPSSHCRNFDHANTYLWIDNVTAEAGAGGGDPLAKFNEVKEEKLGLADRIDANAFGFTEDRAQVELALGSLQEFLKSATNGSEQEEVLGAVQRMIAGEKGTDAVLAGAGPGSSPHLDIDTNISRLTAEYAVNPILELIFAGISLVRAARYIPGLRGVSRMVARNLANLVADLAGHVSKNLERLVRAQGEEAGFAIFEAAESATKTAGQPISEEKFRGIRDEESDPFIEDSSVVIFEDMLFDRNHDFQDIPTATLDDSLNALVDGLSVQSGDLDIEGSTEDAIGRGEAFVEEVNADYELLDEKLTEGLNASILRTIGALEAVLTAVGVTSEVIGSYLAAGTIASGGALLAGLGVGVALSLMQWGLGAVGILEQRYSHQNMVLQVLDPSEVA